MLFDHTRITIRERNFFEILDLALLVVRAGWQGLGVAFVVGVIPAAIINDLLIGSLLDQNEIWNDARSYTFWLALLMVLEAPLATAPVTLLLGQANFRRKIRWRQLVRDYVASLPQMIYYQVIIRGLMALLLVIGIAIPYVFWPYLSEIILLERNPWSAKTGQRLTTWRRCRTLHGRAGSDIVGRWVASIGVGVVLWGSLQWGMISLAGSLTGSWPDEVHIFRYYLPAAAWLVVGFFAVVRFLAYLDTRIRCEGWEVELTMRAEAARLMGGLAPS